MYMDEPGSWVQKITVMMFVYQFELGYVKSLHQLGYVETRLNPFLVDLAGMTQLEYFCVCMYSLCIGSKVRATNQQVNVA